MKRMIHALIRNMVWQLKVCCGWTFHIVVIECTEQSLRESPRVVRL